MHSTLVTAADTLIGKALVSELRTRGNNVVEMTSVELSNLVDDKPFRAEFFLRAFDEVIHVVASPSLGGLLANTAGTGMLDYCTRLTYELLLASSQAQVKQFTLVSTMDLFNAYPAHMVVSPIWATVATPELSVLGPFLAEFISKQFARAGLMRVLVARIGEVPSGESLSVFKTTEVAAAKEILSDHFRQADFWTHMFQPNILWWKVVHIHDDVHAPANLQAEISESPGELPMGVPAKEMASGKTRVLVLGANGFLGPHLINALGAEQYEVIATDKPEGRGHEPEAATVWREKVLAASGGVQGAVLPIDIGDAEAVDSLASKADVIVNCACARNDRRLTWRANCLGTYNAVQSAMKHGHHRFINTGPMFAVTGADYEDYDDMISEDVPPHPGVKLYAISKACGHLITMVLVNSDQNQRRGLHVLNCLFREFFNPEPSDERRFDGSGAAGGDTSTMSISWRDAASLLKRCLEVDLSALSSRCEVFFGHANTPHGRYTSRKTQRVLDWTPKDDLAGYWTRLGISKDGSMQEEKESEQPHKKCRR